MTEQYYHPELVRFAFVFGVVVSILFYERFQLTTGGIAAPGYLAFALFEPLILPGLLMVAFASHAIVHRGLAQMVLIPAAAQFSLLILVSATLHFLLDLLLISYAGLTPNSQVLRGIGYVIPGLVAHDFARHGILRTIGSVSVTSLLVAVALGAVLLALPETGRMRASTVTDTITVALQYMPMLILISLIAWLGLVRQYGLRCGGFLGGAFLSLLVLQPEELARFATAICMTLIIVKYLLPRVTILFGRRRFAAHLLVGACLYWTIVRISELYFNVGTVSVLTPSLAVIGVLLTGLLSRDIDVAGVTRTLVGSALSVGFSLTGTLLLVETLTHQRPHIAAPLLGILLVGGALMATPPTNLRRICLQVIGRKSNVD